MDSRDGEENRKQSRVHFEMMDKDHDLDVLSNSSNSSSSFASDLSEEFFINAIFNSNSSLPTKPDAGVEISSATQISENKSECLSRVSSQSKSASQIRLSGLLGSGEGSRIPGSIFSAKPSNPMEWSIASTESLFSIHVGNSSFSRDHFNYMTKSGELMMNATDFPHHSANLTHHVIEAAKIENKPENVGNVAAAISAPIAGDYRKEGLKTMEELRTRNSVSCLSEDSISSARSFKFPVLAGGSGTPASSSSGTPSKEQQSTAWHQLQEAKSASPTARKGWFSCLSFCRR